MKAFSLIYLLALVTLFGCKYFQNKNLTPVSKPEKVSKIYLPEQYYDSDRINKLTDFKPVIDSVYKAYAEKLHIPGIVYGLVIDDKLLYSNGFGITNISRNYPATNRSVFRIASMSKSFTALAILKLQEKGKLLVTEPAQNYLPELKSLTYLTADASLITIENLMTMTSGLPEDNPWADRQLDMTEKEFTELLKGGFSLSNNPSTTYEYSNLGYAMLGRIITNVSGIPYQEYIKENIFDALKMNNTYWEYSEVPDSLLAQGYRYHNGKWIEEPMLHDGAFGSIGGIITSIKDFSKYVSYLLSAYPYKDDAEYGPVKRSLLRDMQRTRVTRLAPDEVDEDGNPCSMVLGYAYGLRTELACDGFKNIGHSGGLPGFGSHFYILPDYGLGIISFANLTYAGPWKADDQVIHLLRKNNIIQPHSLSVSEILKTRQKQLVQLLKNREGDLEEEILAENFYLDKSHEQRLKEIETTLTQAGEIISAETISPQNQLRGTFILSCSKQNVEVYFTLTPEKNPKIQYLSFKVVEKNF